MRQFEFDSFWVKNEREKCIMSWITTVYMFITGNINVAINLVITVFGSNVICVSSIISLCIIDFTTSYLKAESAIVLIFSGTIRLPLWLVELLRAEILRISRNL